MNYSHLRNIFFAIFFIALTSISSAQEGNITVVQDEKVSTLLDLKIQLAKENKLNDRYKIQLFYGDLEKANKILADYRKSSLEWSSNIEYETPNYKVWVGNFRNRLEADRALMTIKTIFPEAFIFKPKL